MDSHDHLIKDRKTNGKLWANSIKLALTAFILTACGSEEANQQGYIDTGTNSKVALYAQNITARTAKGAPVAIDLTDKVVLSSDVDFKLSQLPQLVKGEEQGCEISTLNSSQTAVAVSSDEVADCIYQYQVEASSENSTPASGYLRVGVGRDYSDNTLPTITKNLASITSIDIDIKAELVAQHSNVTAAELTDFELDEHIIVLGNGNAVKNGSGGIQYTPTDSAPSVTILFSLRKEDEIKLGTLLVAVSDPSSGNQLPVAQNYVYPYDITVSNYTSHGLVKGFDLQNTTDPTTPSLISDPDGDILQLVDVQSINNTLTLYESDDFTNTKFDLETTTEGWQDVVYTVTDHNGGYAIGTISFYLKADYSIVRKWQDITIEDPKIGIDITFLAPLTASEAESLNLNYTDKGIEVDLDGKPEVMRMTYEQAEAYCAMRDARLPLIRELNTLNVVEGDLFTQHGWPKEYSYWTTKKIAEDNGTAYYASQTDSTSRGTLENVPYVDAYGNNDSRYVTCIPVTKSATVIGGGASDFTSTTDVVKDGTVNIKSILTTTLLDPDGDPAPFHLVTLKSVAQAGTLLYTKEDGTLVMVDLNGTTVYTDANGQYEYYYYDHSFNDELVNVLRYERLLEMVNITPSELSAPRLDFDNANWIRQNFEGSYQGISNTTQYYPMNQYGLPLWRVDYLPVTNDPDYPDYQYVRMVNLYQKPYKGKSFMGRLKIAQHGPNPPHFGRIVLSLQQVNKTDPSKMQGTSSMPGLSSQEQQMSIMVDYTNSKVMVLNKRDDPDMTEMPIDGLRQQFTYMWFIYSNTTNQLRVYLSYTEQRPKCPLSYQEGGSTKYAIGANWGTQMFVDHVDNNVPNKDEYFLNITSRIQMSDVYPTVNTSYLEFIDFVTWTDPAADVDAGAIAIQCGS